MRCSRALADATLAWHHPREGKRTAVFADTLERTPSGKFATNSLVLSPSALAYNVLRLIGQNALTSPDPPPRQPAKRRRLRTVIQEMLALAAAVSQHARQRLLVFAAHCPALACCRWLHGQRSTAP